MLRLCISPPSTRHKLLPSCPVVSLRSANRAFPAEAWVVFDACGSSSWGGSVVLLLPCGIILTPHCRRLVRHERILYFSRVSSISALVEPMRTLRLRLRPMMMRFSFVVFLLLLRARFATFANDDELTHLRVVCNEIVFSLKVQIPCLNVLFSRVLIMGWRRLGACYSKISGCVWQMIGCVT